MSKDHASLFDQPKSKPTALGKMMARFNKARLHTKQTAIDELWRRNKIDPDKDHAQYKVIEKTSIKGDGAEVTEYVLYKVVDSTTVTISAEIKSEVRIGEKTV